MYTISYADTCLPDYFNGSSLPVVQVIVTKESTFKEIKENLLDYSAYDHLFEDYRFDTTSETIGGFDFDTYKASVEEYFETVADYGTSLDSVPSSCLYIDEVPEDDESGYDSVYMYFTIDANLE